MRAKYYFGLIGVLIGAFAYKAWFFGGHTLTYGDWGYYTHLTQVSLLTAPSAWDSKAIGAVNVVASFYPILFAWGLLGHVASFALSERILFMWPIIILSSLGSFFLIHKVVRNDIGALVGSFLYTFNTYFLIINMGDLTIGMAFALAPWIMLVYILALERPSLMLSVALALLCFTCGAYEFRIFYLITWLFITLFIFKYFQLRTTSQRKDILRKVGLPLIGLCLFLNAYWLIGLSKLGQISSNAVFSKDLFGNQYFNINEAITLFHPFWTFSGVRFYEVQQVPFFFWLVPIIAFAGLYVSRRNWLVIYFASIALIGVLLTKQIAQPLTSLYPWLFTHLPGFNAFREASKFYFFVMLGYSVLVASLVAWVYSGKGRWRGHFRGWILAVILAGLFLINLKPLVSGDMSYLTTGRSIPSEYTIFNSIIEKDPSYSRTAWVPSVPVWVDQSKSIGEVGVYSEIGSDWTNLRPDKDILSSMSGQFVNDRILQQNYYGRILGTASIKRVGVPLIDSANADNPFGNASRTRVIATLNSLSWLNRVNIGTKDVAIYENKDYKPYLTTTTKLVGLDSLENLEQKYSFITGALKQDFVFGSPGTMTPNTGLQDTFESPRLSDVKGGALSAGVRGSSGQTEYIDTNQGNVSYQVTGGILILTQHLQNSLKADSDVLGPQQDTQKPLLSVPLSSGEYMVGVGNNLLPINTASTAVRDIGVPSKAPVVYAVAPSNRVANGDLTAGLWQRQVEDCNDYDNRGSSLFMNLVPDNAYKTKVLELAASRHTACTGPAPVSVTGGEQLLVQFDYRVVQGKEASYELQYNDPAHTVAQDYLPVTDASWRTLHRLVIVPAGATSMRLVLKAAPNEQNPLQGVARYTNVRVSGLSVAAQVPLDTTPQYAQVAVPIGTKTLSVSQAGLTGANLIKNPSLEQGLWQQKVGDCNAHDNNPQLGMRLESNNVTDGEQALELTAKRHIACTGPQPMPVKEGQTYLLSFNYQSPTESNGGYSVAFNDGDRTRVSNGDLQTPDKTWHTLTKTFTVPYGATAASLSVYSYSDESSGQTKVNHYDNFHLVQIPQAQGLYYTVKAGPANLVTPKNINFSLNSPTSKTVHITGATTPFYLNMSEAYHDKWQLEMKNNKVEGFFDSWVPWIHPDVVPASDHYKLDDFANGWYVDVNSLCKQQNLCHKNADGSYDMDMQVEFTPQRWFYVGSIISGLTLLGCVGYLGVYGVRRLRRRHDA